MFYRLSTNCRRLRVAKGYTQHELSAVCGFPGSYIGDIEQMTVNITLANLEALCNGLNCTAYDLLMKPPGETR